MPASFIERHPFPGPGLAIRIPGEITREKLDILRKADAIFINELKNKINIEVFKYDERLSSKEAVRYLKNQNIRTGHNKEKIDQISASIILEQFLATL